MPKGSRVQDHIDEELKDPEFAASYLASALEEGDDVLIRDTINI